MGHWNRLNSPDAQDKVRTEDFQIRHLVPSSCDSFLHSLKLLMCMIPQKGTEKAALSDFIPGLQSRLHFAHRKRSSLKRYYFLIFPS
jgi:hypothetical protein